MSCVSVGIVIFENWWDRVGRWKHPSKYAKLMKIFLWLCDRPVFKFWKYDCNNELRFDYSRFETQLEFSVRSKIKVAMIRNYRKIIRRNDELHRFYVSEMRRKAELDLKRGRL